MNKPRRFWAASRPEQAPVGPGKGPGRGRARVAPIFGPAGYPTAGRGDSSCTVCICKPRYSRRCNSPSIAAQMHTRSRRTVHIARHTGTQKMGSIIWRQGDMRRVDKQRHGASERCAMRILEKFVVSDEECAMFEPQAVGPCYETRKFISHDFQFRRRSVP